MQKGSFSLERKYGMSGKHAVSRSIYWEASNGIFLLYYCLFCWLYQSSGEGSKKLDSASEVYIFIGNNCRKWYQLFVLSPFPAENLRGNLYQQNHTATFNQSCEVLICIRKRCIFWKNNHCHFLSEKQLHIKLVRMKPLNCRDEARSSFRYINQRNFVFQQENSLSHRSDWWKTFQENFVVDVMIFKIISFSFSQQKDSLCVENKLIVSKRRLVFYRWF